MEWDFHLFIDVFFEGMSWHHYPCIFGQLAVGGDEPSQASNQSMSDIDALKIDSICQFSDLFINLSLDQLHNIVEAVNQAFRTDMTIPCMWMIEHWPDIGQVNSASLSQNSNGHGLKSAGTGRQINYGRLHGEHFACLVGEYSHLDFFLALSAPKQRTWNCRKRVQIICGSSQHHRHNESVIEPQENLKSGMWTLSNMHALQSMTWSLLSTFSTWRLEKSPLFVLVCFDSLFFISGNAWMCQLDSMDTILVKEMPSRHYRIPKERPLQSFYSLWFLPSGPMPDGLHLWWGKSKLCGESHMWVLLLCMW